MALRGTLSKITSFGLGFEGCTRNMSVIKAMYEDAKTKERVNGRE